MLFFLTLRSVQPLPDPRIVDGIKIKLFRAKTITRKIILEGGLVAVENGSRSGSGSGAVVEANAAPLTVFETTSHYYYDHTGCTDFFTSSECSICKCQDCKTKHDGVINAINSLTTSIKKMASKRGIMPSKRISYPYTPLETKVAKRRRKDTSKASSSIGKRKIAMPLSLSCTDIQCARVIREQHDLKMVNPEVSRNEEYLINIIKGFRILAGLPWYLVDKVYIPINYGDEFHWVLVVVVLKERCIRVYDSVLRKRRSGPSSEIQKLAKILPTYLDMSGFLNQKVNTDWSTIEVYRNKMGNPFDA
ncbi:hypothetical protein CQW23_10707 [Capsicum baccatum]|uniref:Ubiquitin-like protease family profile domain-containing protein n=1 Tax=Capsicum baccatum TaxID=33114 RepID=A0A2G2X0H6_CAPBA|nr:hypothetical protein CQW23_10707 [Capsicum baccatum]